MNWPATVVIIVALMILARSIRHAQNAKNGVASDRRGNPIAPTGPSPREKEMEIELEQMRERLQVLERIATDEHDTTRLSDEIDKLRDE